MQLLQLLTLQTTQAELSVLVVYPLLQVSQRLISLGIHVAQLSMEHWMIQVDEPKRM